jgi:16S rRNA (uracil1498-N3)-methyltransferase
MPRYDFRSPRLYLDAPLGEGVNLTLSHAQAHYLANVLRLRSGSHILVFNGRDGEWSTVLAGTRRAATLIVGAKTREQTPTTDLHYLFAPLKAARLDYMVQKAVEMGVSLVQPVMTRHTQVTRVNVERMRANVIEAAEQCGVLCVPVVMPPLALPRLLAERDPSRCLIFCDEDAAATSPIAALAGQQGRPLAVLIGPEGGFAEDERAALLKLPNAIRISLGPRILRADTAAVAALSLVQALAGDWQ